MRKKIIIGNWKMFKTNVETCSFLQELQHLIANKKPNCDYGIAASFTNLAILKAQQPSSSFIVAAQNCHWANNGAFTGEISHLMLSELGTTHVLIGHSERRQYFNETDEDINKKLHQLLNNTQIIPVLCCGETEAEYEANETKQVIEKQITTAFKNLNASQIEKIIIAYEPIWAIGTGKTASATIAQNVCSFIRSLVAKIADQSTADKLRIQYGGSVKPDNIKSFFQEPDIDGALVGGASLSPADFYQLLV